MAQDESGLAEKLKQYLSENQILIVDTVSSARINLAVTLSKLGGIRSQMTLVGSLSEAQAAIETKKPKLIFSDYELGNAYGLDLIQDQKAKLSKSEWSSSLFVLVTANASQSAVARAAEEDVDTFVIKPYTLNTLRDSLAQTVETKKNPSRYLQLIEAGKEKLFNKQYDDSIALFEEAKKEHPEPTLACFYAGQAEFLKTKVAEAQANYQRGLSFNGIHYKCLVGLFDLLSEEKKFIEAYGVIKKLAQFFPANPKRLTSVLRLAILTENFQDMAEYYQIFVQMDRRSEELIRAMCSALVVSGKYYLRNQLPKRASEVFEQASASAGGRTQILLYALETLVNYGVRPDSEKIVSRLAMLAPASQDFGVAQFLLSTLKEKPLVSLRAGQILIEKGAGTPIVFEKCIYLATQEKDNAGADLLFEQAAKKWPERLQKFKDARALVRSV